MAASTAMPSLLLLLAVLVAAADAYSPATAAGAVPDPNIFNPDALCLKTTDVKGCQTLVRNMPANVSGKTDAKSIAQECIATAAFMADEGSKACVDAVEEAKKVDKCLDSCSQTFTAVCDALEPGGTGGNAVKVPEDERLLAIHASLTQLLRGPGAAAGGPPRGPPLCKMCCLDGSCMDQAKKLDVVTIFMRMWSLLDFTDAVLEDLYPLTKMNGAKATTTGSTANKDAYAATGSTEGKETSAAGSTEGKETAAAAGSTEGKETVVAAGSTEGKETSTATGSTADKNAYPAAGSTADKETSVAAGSTTDKETSPAVGSETSAATGSTADKNAYPAAGSTADKETSPAAAPTAEKEISAAAGSTADKEASAAAGSTADKEASAVAGSTTDKEASAVTGSTADKNTYPAAGSTANKETSAAVGSTAEKETSPVAGSTADKTYAAAGSAPVVDTAPAPPVRTYD
uniref:Pectinesterase inhibitor domain-containing protein n=1 Tax=Oryza punctata TaxID=4537 RepID=A0A0E0ME06_ORYPU